MKSSPIKRRPSWGSSMERRVSSHTATTLSSTSRSSGEAVRKERRADAPIRQRCPESPNKRNSHKEGFASPQGPRHQVSPLMKAKFIPMISLTRSPVKEAGASHKNDKLMFLSSTVTPPPPLGNFLGPESDSRMRHSRHISSDATVADQTMTSSMSQFTGRRASSRHPKRHIAVIEPHRRVAPQRSRSLTDMRDMLRPTSDPRRKTRATSTQKERLNPLEAFFTSQVLVAPSVKDSKTVAKAIPAGVTAKRPLARRLERHKAVSHRKLSESLHAECAQQPTTRVRRMAPQRSRSLTDMRDMARLALRKNDSPSVVEFQAPSEWKAYFSSGEL